MRAVVQRVLHASVTVEGTVAGQIDCGLVAFVGVGADDGPGDADYIADKIAGMRVFEDSRGKMSLSVDQVRGAVLAVSQFTLYGDMRKGRRPGFDKAKEPLEAKALFARVVAGLRQRGCRVQQGVFGAMMQVQVQNDGPVTILIDSEKHF